MTNVKTTQLSGLKKQLEQIQLDLSKIEGYQETDLNPYWEAFCSVGNAISELHYAIKEAKNE